jgi:hypothetical protein
MKHIRKEVNMAAHLLATRMFQIFTKEIWMEEYLKFLRDVISANSQFRNLINIESIFYHWEHL